MTSAPSGAITTDLIILVLICLMLGRRTYLQLTGAPYSPSRLFVFAGFYVFLFALLGAGTIYAAILTWGTDAFVLLAPYIAIPVATAYFAAPFVERIVRFDRRGGGQWYYTLPWHIPILYLLLFVARVAGEIVVLGPSAFFTFPPPPPSSSLALDVLVAIDLLFAASTGLLLARGFGIYRAHQKLPPDAAPPPSPSPPLPHS